MIDEIAAALGIKKGVVLWGLLGALVSLYFSQPGLHWCAKLTYFGGGVACAWVGAPALAEQFGVAGTHSISLIGFVLGVFGMSAMAAITTALRETKLADSLATWLKRPGA